MNSPQARLRTKQAPTTPSKRQRTLSTDPTIESAGYMQGAIVRIALRNFVTYDRCEFFPGPHLNMIIGPNGTGKSTVVCAMALGLGGSPALLGRSKEVSDFVKHGHEKAVIEIELYRPPPQGNVIIRRQIKRSTNTSTWKINGHDALHRDVMAIVKELRIQVDNLCQFLPQDRVSEFAQMSPAELLVETQKAAGEDELYEQHKELVKQRKEEKSLLQAIEQETAHIDQLSKRNAVLERDVARFQERENILRQITLLEHGLVLMRYDMYKAEFEKAKEEHKTATEQYIALERESQPYLDQAAQITEQQEELKARQRQLAEDYSRRGRELGQITNKIDQMLSDSAAQRRGFRDIRQREKQRQARIKALSNKIKEMEEQMPEPPPKVDTSKIDKKLQEYRESYQALITEQNDYRTELQNIQRQGQEIQNQLTDVQKKLARLSNIKNQRLEKVRREDRAAYQAYMWLEENRARFRGTIYGPICLDLQLKDPVYVKAIEATLGHLMMAFVCTTKEDYYTLTRELIDRRQLRISVFYSPNSLVNYQPEFSKSQLAKWGMETFLVDAVEAPEAVLVVLCEQRKLHKTPFARGKVNDEAIIERRLFNNYIADNTRTVVQYSAYGRKDPSAQTVILREAQLLITSVNAEEREQLVQESDRYRRQLEENAARVRTIKMNEQKVAEEIATVQRNKEKLVEEKRSIQAKRHAYERAQTQLDMRKRELQRMIDEPDNIEEERQQLQAELRESARKCSQTIQQFKELVKQQRQTLERKTLATFTFVEELRRLDEIQNVIRSRKEALERLERECHEVEKRKTKAKREAQAARRQITLITADLDDITLAQLEELRRTKTMIEVEDELVSKRAQAELTHATNPNIIREYEERRDMILQLREKLQAKQEKLEQVQQTIQALRSTWVPSIQALVREVSAAFSAAFEAIGCSGEVRICQHEDYDQWGIEIMVKFRDHEAMQPLDGQRQSGGERSVSTILYLMALQQRATAPFRVVDEINQGMDPHNERMVHQRLVEVSCQPNTPQYFLVTPKLLPNLVYHDLMKVHCIFNGEWQPEKFNVRTFLRQRRQRGTANATN